MELNCDFSELENLVVDMNKTTIEPEFKKESDLKMVVLCPNCNEYHDFDIFKTKYVKKNEMG